MQMSIDSITNRSLSSEVRGEISTFLEYAWKEDLLWRLRRGSLNISELNSQISMPVYGHQMALEIKALVLPYFLMTWIEDLEKGGSLTKDGETLTGLGEYAQIPISEIEREILSVLRSARGRTMTETGLLRKMKSSGLGNKQIEEGLGSLVRKGYVWTNEVNKAGNLLFTAL
jgi:hypothetical protein